MPQVPVRRLPEQQLQALGAPFASTSSRDIPADAFGAGAARDLTQAGQDLQALGADLGAEALRLAIERNSADARAADVAFGDAIRTTLYDPEQGYLNSRGEAAVSGQEQTQQRLRAELARISADLRTDAARDLFTEAAEQRLSRALLLVDRHASTELTTYNNNASVARYESALLDLDASGGDPEAIRVARTIAVAETGRQAQLMGWGAEHADVVLRGRFADISERYFMARLSRGDAGGVLRDLNADGEYAAALTAEQRRRITRLAEQDVRAAQAAYRSSVADRLALEAAHLEDGIEPPGELVSEATILSAFGPEVLADVVTQRETWRLQQEMLGLPPERQEAMVADAAPTRGADYIRQRDQFRALEAALVDIRAEAAEQGEPRLQNELNILAAGRIPQDPIQESEMLVWFGTDRGTEAFGNLMALREVVVATRGFLGQTPAEIQATVDRFDPESGADFENQDRLHQIAVTARDRDHDLRQDPAAYATLVDPDLLAAYQTAETAEDMRVAIRWSLAVQAQAGIAPEDRRPLTGSAAARFVDIWNNNANGADRVALLRGVTSDLGDPTLAGLVLDQLLDADLPGAGMAVAIMDVPAQDRAASQVAQIASSTTDDLRAGIPESDADAIDNATLDEVPAYRDFRASLATNLDPSGRVAMIQSEIQRLAYDMVRRGVAPANVALGRAADRILGDRYDFVVFNENMFRIPVVVASDEARAAGILQGAWATILRQEAFEEHVGTLDLISVNPELPEVTTQEQGRQALQGHGYWITSPDESGLMLMWEGGNAVQREDGTFVELTWSELTRIGGQYPVALPTEPSVYGGP